MKSPTEITDEFFEKNPIGKVLAPVLGIGLIVLLLWVMFSSDICNDGCWREFDWPGRGGNPQTGDLYDY